MSTRADTYDPQWRWFGGYTCDHLYADCPNRQRALNAAALREADREWLEVTNTGIDPLGTDVCGLCVHRWRRAAA